MAFEKGDTIIVAGRGASYGQGVPVNMDGRRAKVLSVDPKLMTVLIQGEIFVRKSRISMDVKRKVNRGR